MKTGKRYQGAEPGANPLAPVKPVTSAHRLDELWLTRRGNLGQPVSVMFWILATIISIAMFAALIFAVHLLERVAIPTPARRERSDSRRYVRGT
jgi:hypothetical protein